MISCQFEQYSKKKFLKKHQLTVNQLGVFNEDECIIDIFFILSFISQNFMSLWALILTILLILTHFHICFDGIFFVILIKK